MPLVLLSSTSKASVFDRVAQSLTIRTDVGTVDCADFAKIVSLARQLRLHDGHVESSVNAGHGLIIEQSKPRHGIVPCLELAFRTNPHATVVQAFVDHYGRFVIKREIQDDVFAAFLVPVFPTFDSWSQRPSPSPESGALRIRDRCA